MTDDPNDAHKRELGDLQKKLGDLEAEIKNLKNAQIPKLDDRVKQVHDYAWAWFNYHAQQRTSVFNFFLAAAALLFAGFGAAINEGNNLLAGGIGVIGAIVSLSFIAVDGRNQELVTHGKNVLEKTEGALFAAVNADGASGFGAGIVKSDLSRGALASIWHGKHGFHFRWLELVVFAAFVYGTYLAFAKPDKFASSKQSDADKIVNAINPVASSVQKLDDALSRAALMLASAHVVAPAPPLVAPPPLFSPSGSGGGSGSKHGRRQ